MKEDRQANNERNERERRLLEALLADIDLEDVAATLSPDLLMRFALDEVHGAEREVVEAAIELDPTLHNTLEELRATLVSLRERERAEALVRALLQESAEDERWAISPELVRRFALSEVSPVEREVVEAAIELDPPLALEIREMQETQDFLANPEAQTRFAPPPSPKRGFREVWQGLLTVPSLITGMGGAALSAVLILIFFRNTPNALPPPRDNLAPPPNSSAELDKARENNKKLEETLRRQQKRTEEAEKAARKAISDLKSAQSKPAPVSKGLIGITNSASVSGQTMGADEGEIEIREGANTFTKSLRPTLRWKPILGVERYRVTLHKVSADGVASSPIEATTVEGTEYRVKSLLKLDTKYVWEVGELTEANSGQRQRGYFRTPNAKLYQATQKALAIQAQDDLKAGYLDDALRKAMTLDDENARAKLLEVIRQRKGE